MMIYKNANIIVLLIAVNLLTSCAYMKSSSKQDEYMQNLEISPRQHTIKHLIDKEKYLVYGRIVDDTGQNISQPLAVAAFSDRFKPHELVDVTHFAGVGRHYVLNLPVGKYDLLVLANKDKNKNYNEAEVIGRRQVELKSSKVKVLTDVDINLSRNHNVDWDINIPVAMAPASEESLVYPKGTIRRFDDPIFGRELSTLGVYEPVAFLEQTPTNFYTLEEYSPYKIPVIFIHGMGGTVREFIPIIDQMDRERYVPWFYYYPSGRDLDQSAENFYRLYLSGRLFPRMGPSMVIVAHSMGGLVAREALNLHRGTSDENTVAKLITIASPFGGHPDAASGVKHAPMVLPAWRDLHPDGKFIRKLFRKPLPASTQHQLLYSYANPETFKPDDNSDGVVPLYSQLRPAAQIQSDRNMGFNSSHAGILKDEAAIDFIVKSIQTVKGYYPESHIIAMQEGGFNVELDKKYDNREKYVIRVLGKYFAALTNGQLDVVTQYQQHFLDAIHGKTSASTFVETAWLKFMKDYPELVNHVKQ